MKNFIMGLAIVLIILGVLLLLGFVKIWPQRVKTGTTRVDSYTKIQVMMGTLYID